jgi:hypothetical protein
LDGALVPLVVVTCFWVFLPPADIDMADEAGALFLAVCAGQELVPVLEGAIWKTWSEMTEKDSTMIGWMVVE